MWTRSWRRLKSSKAEWRDAGSAAHPARFAVVLSLFLLLPISSAADIYKWTDEEGKLHYTNDPAQLPAIHQKRPRTIISEDSRPAAKDKPSVPEEAAEKSPADGLKAGRQGDAIPPPFPSAPRTRFPDLLADGATVPDGDFTDLGGRRQSIGGLRGNIVLLNFWATWCGPCREEMPPMQRLYEQLNARRGFAMLAVSDENAGKVAAFVKKNGYTFPVAIDAKGQGNERFGASSLPTTYILDRDGRVLVAQVGATQWDHPAIVAWLRQLLASR